MSARRQLLIAILSGALVAPVFISGCASESARSDAASPAALQPAESAPPPASTSVGAERPTTSATSAGPGRRRARVPLYPRTHEHNVALPDGASIIVEGYNGAVVVEGQARSDVFIEATANGLSVERSDAAAIEANLSDNILRIALRWPDGPQSIEGGVLRILVPTGAKLAQIRTTVGVISISDAGGDVVVRTAEGDVRVVNHQGGVDAETANARVTIDQPGGPVAARTANGVIAITGAPGRVDATTTNAGIDVRLHADSPGPVRLETTNAVVLLTVGDAFTGALTAETTRSPIEIGPGVDPSRVEFSDAFRARFDFGGGEPSMIKTIRGGIKVSRQD